MLRCAVSVPKLAIAAPVNVKNTIANTVNAVLHLAVAVPILVAKWLQLWHKYLLLLTAALQFIDVAVSNRNLSKSTKQDYILLFTTYNFEIQIFYI